MILLYTFFSVISFAHYKEYMICLIPFSKFSDVLHAFTCARTIVNLWSISLGVKIFHPFPCFSFIGNIPLLKALTINSQPWQRLFTLSKLFLFLSLSYFVLGLDFLLNYFQFLNILVWFISASCILILPV